MYCELFQNNAHKLTLVMTPEEDYSMTCREAEMRKLMHKLSGLSADEKENVYKTGKESFFWVLLLLHSLLFVW